MITVTVNYSDETFSGPDAESVVALMAERNFGGCRGDLDYMEEAAKRIGVLENITIRTHSAHAFLIDLRDAGMIKYVSRED